ANFEKAMKIVRRVLSRDMPETIAKRLEEMARGPYAPYREVLEVARPQLPRVSRDAKIIACLPPHTPLSLHDLGRLRSQMEKLLKGLGWPTEPFIPFDDDTRPVTEALAQAGIAVVQASPDDTMVKVLRKTFHAGRASHALAVIEPADAAGPLAGVTNQAIKLLERCGIRFSAVSWATFPEASAIASRPFLVTPGTGSLVAALGHAALKEDEKPPLLPQLASDRGRLVVNVMHALTRRLAAAWEVDPCAAAYLFAKMLCLCDGLHPQMEARLLQHSLEDRTRV
ncbi:MAG: hypothetical protein ACYCW6_08320, partial [Candidatus Xenobia bacterium]